MLRILAVISLSLSIAACAPSDPAASGSAPQSAPETTFASPYFEVTVAGEGANVILVPGFASNAAIWDDTVSALESEYRLHVVQVSGFGGAPVNGNAGNSDILDDLAHDLARYTETLDNAPVLVGHSLGGLVTLKTAIQTDAELDSIVIVDVLPFFSILIDEAATADGMQPVAAIMKATLLAQPEAEFETSQNTALATLVKSDAHRAQALEWSKRSDRSVMAQAMSEVLVTDLRADIAAINVPVTVLFARDEAIPNMDAIEAFYHDLYAPLTEGTIIPIDAALHFIMLDQPEAFLTALRGALER